MRGLLWGLMAVGAVAVMDAAPAAAGNYPFCIKGCDFGAGDCSFTSYQQCQATASGREAWCTTNPYFNASAELQPDHRRMSRRRF